LTLQITPLKRERLPIWITAHAPIRSSIAPLPTRNRVDPIPATPRFNTMDILTRELAKTDRIPTVALLLGWAGVAPFAGLTALATLDGSARSAAAIAALVGYGAIILSFMGGVLWGLAMTRCRSQAVYAVSVLPAVVSAAAMLAQAKLGILILLFGFAGLLAYDLSCSRSGGAPGWYPVLRWQLTAAVVAFLSMALLFARQP